ncbi:MAG TPA: hypothetical protein VF257_01690 [Solirubrobacteraceae bacterium]
MTIFKKLLGDFADKRVWPIALVLVAGLVAVPLMLGRGSSPEPVAAVPATAGTPTTPTSRAAITLDESADESHGGAGAARDPFKGPKVVKAATTDAAKQTASGGGGGASTPPAGSSGGTTGGGTSGGTGNTGSSGGLDPELSHVTLRLGKVGELTTYKDVARLSALPSAGNPQFVFTGVLKDGKTAVLLPSSLIQLSPESDVSCKPSNKSCERIEMEEDDTIFFTLLGDAQNVQYELDVLSVRQAAAGSAKATTAALQRHSKAGAAMLRDAHINAGTAFKGASAYRWLPDRGVLVRTPQHSKARASADGASAASTADVNAVLPGLPVWHWESGSQRRHKGSTSRP